MTWKEFKEAVEAEGVTDDMELGYIDCGSAIIGVHVYGYEHWPKDHPKRFCVE